MPRTPVEEAQACAALWVVHTVQLASYGRHTCTGPHTLDGEPAPRDAAEGALMFQKAVDLTAALHTRAERLGLDLDAVAAAFDLVASDAVIWPEIQANYRHSLRLIGGALDA